MDVIIESLLQNLRQKRVFEGEVCGGFFGGKIFLSIFRRKTFGSAPTTPDPNTSAKASRYKREAYRDINSWCAYIYIYIAFWQEESILLQKYRDRNGRCIAILFKSIGVRGRCDPPETCLYICHQNFTTFFTLKFTISEKSLCP